MTSPSVAGHAPALRARRHPVAYSADLASGEPLAVDLLGQALVLWRDSTRSSTSASIAAPRCRSAPSRVTRSCAPTTAALPLRRSLHARFPSSPIRRACPPRPVRPRSRAPERYGMVWVALEEPRWALPEVPSSRIRPGRPCHCGPYWWACDASRQVENFTDFGHFPFVHPGAARRSGAAGRARSRGRDRRPRPPLRDRPARGSGERGVPGVRQRGRRVRPSAAAATSSTCRTRSCCGSAGAARRAWSTSSPAGREGPDRTTGFLAIGPQLQPRAARRRCCRTSRT